MKLTYKCTFCSKEFTRQNSFTQHYKFCEKNPDNSLKERKFVCCWCRKSFLTKSVLKEHKVQNHPEYQGHSWNKGLRKENSELLNSISNKTSKTLLGRRKTYIFKTDFSDRYCRMCNNHLSFRNKTGYCKSCNLKFRTFSDDTKRKISEAARRRVLNGTHNGWNSRNIKSYAELFWETVLDNNRIKYKREVKVGKYFLDFVIGNIDLEIDGKQHRYPDRIASDLIRDEFLRSKGYFVYRIRWNEINSKSGKEMMKDKIDLFLDFFEFMESCPTTRNSLV